MKIRNIFLLRPFATLLIIFSFIVTTPLVATAADRKGNKNYKQGLKYEVAEQWDKAAEEFALAVASKPEDPEYRLHYRRALFNASQMMMQRGRVFSEQKNYSAGYNAFRQAFGYDPTNELAKAEMDRMLRLQKETEDPNDPNKPKESPTAQPSGVKLIPTAYSSAQQSQTQPQQQQDTQQLEPLRDIKYTKVDLKSVIRDLAQSLDLNVLFDSQTFRPGQPRDLTIELKNVTTAQALDYIFLQEGLFFQKIGKRTIVVADTQTQRQKFQQLVLRTFYLANAKPDDVRNIITQAIPPQPGRPPSQAIVDKDTNSITVRDTSENIKIIAELIKAVDKDRAEVVMDVNIYEVSKTDLLQLGNQFLTAGPNGEIPTLGSTSTGYFGTGGSRNSTLAADVAKIATNGLGVGLLLPASSLVAFQSKDNTKLLASTQVHAFNNEESTARIGRRVPVQTAQLLGYNNQPGQTNSGTGINNAASVINYEQVGLTLKFTPIVFPNQDVQVKMSIESKDVLNGTLTPTFTERSITGTARIQNNRTLMLASVAQDSQSDGKQGLPLLGLIPIFGRLFTAPKRSNAQVDIVIAVTPRVLRSPTILPEDQSERATGSIAVPTSSSLSDMIRREDLDDQIAAARRLPNNPVVQLPDQKVDETALAAPAYSSSSAASARPVSTVPASSILPTITPKPIGTSVKTLNLEQTSEKFNVKQADKNPDLPQIELLDTNISSTTNALSAELGIKSLGSLKAGEKRRVAVMVKSPLALRMAVLSLNFNAAKIAIKSVKYGDIFGVNLANRDAPPFAASNNALIATLPAPQNKSAQGVGVLAYLEIEALTDSVNESFTFDKNATNVIGYSGESLILSIK